MLYRAVFTMISKLEHFFKKLAGPQECKSLPATYEHIKPIQDLTDAKRSPVHECP
jgi:hypothetical protein